MGMNKRSGHPRSKRRNWKDRGKTQAQNGAREKETTAKEVDKKKK